MAISKVIDRTGNVLIDLTEDTVSENDVVLGKTFHDRNGNSKTGTLLTANVTPIIDYNNLVRFFDYDGTIVWSGTILEANALSALPVAPDHTSDNLTFDGWNYTLTDVQNTLKSMDIGAIYKTTDGCSYFPIQLTSDSVSITLKITTGITYNIDWGDGTTDNNLSHTYAQKGKYTIKVDSNNVNYAIISRLLNSNTNLANMVSTVKLSSNVTSISGDAFNGCCNMRYIIIPNSVTYVGTYMFVNNYTLKHINIPNSITNIPTYSFNKCYSLKNVSIPNSVTSISSYAFGSCSSLQCVNIPNSVTNIYSYAFQNCYNLKNITMSNSVIFIDRDAFTSCYSLEYISIPYGITTLSGELLFRCYNITTFNIPRSVTQIDTYAFQDCYNLKNIAIPNSVATINSNAFQGCSSIEYFDFSTHETPPTLASTGTLGYDYTRRFKIIIPAGSYSQYEAATNWSALCALGLVEEASA